MCQGGQVGWHTGSSVLVFYRIEGTQHSSFGEATLYIGELLFKSGLEFGKEFRIFGLAFKKV